MQGNSKTEGKQSISQGMRKFRNSKSTCENFATPNPLAKIFATPQTPCENFATPYLTCEFQWSLVGSQQSAGKPKVF